MAAIKDDFALQGSKCVEDVWKIETRTYANMWNTCTVCDEDLLPEDKYSNKPICAGCRTAIKTFRSAIGY